MVNNSCDTCGTEFQRAEHLSRHKLRHLGERPFTCSKCELAFSRKDTLQRHHSIHTRNDEQPVRRMPPTAKRVKRACHKCSQSKLRCDGNSPCGRCLYKNYTCLYSNSRVSAESHEPQVQETQEQTPEQSTITASSGQDAADSQVPRSDEYSSANHSSLQFPAYLLARDEYPQPTFVPTSGSYDSGPVSVNTLYTTPPSVASQQNHVQFDSFFPQRPALGLEPSDSYLFGTAVQNGTSWDSAQILSPLYQGPYADFELLVPPEHTQPLQLGRLFSGPNIEKGLSDSNAPVPTFLDARSSPEPNEGQDLQFDDYVRGAWTNGNNSRHATRNGQSTPMGQVPRLPGAQRARDYIPRLMGTFSPELSCDGEDNIWEPENLAHVGSLPQQAYDQILAKFRGMNKFNGCYPQFAAGNFPSLSSCNAFMQLFFEEFNPLFPFIHQPTFDPSREHWLLVLAVVTTGCRFSKVSAAVECVDLLQEFVRRAFYATIEEDYNSTYEPWLAQAGLLNQIGMQFSRDVRLTESAQSMRSVLASICRKVNCFNESVQHADMLLNQPSADAWKLWVRRESMRRLAYTLWFIDSQYVLFFDLPPIIPTNLLRVRLPSSEVLWNARTSYLWIETSKHNIYAPLSIRQELHSLYKTKTRQPGLGDFAHLLLVMGVYRSSLLFRHSFLEGFDSQPSLAEDPPQHNKGFEYQRETYPGTTKAMEYLRILCPENDQKPVLSSLKSAIVHHYHVIGILLHISLGELFCYCGYRVTSGDISQCQNRLRAWAQKRGREVRQMAFHAGQVFGCIRRSNMLGYYEGRAMLVACICLWIYGDIGTICPDSRTGIIDGSRKALPSNIRLDQHLGKDLEQSWVEDGAEINPYLAGVGSIVGAHGVSRLVQEGSRVLCSSYTWPICGVMGKSLQIFHKHRSRVGL